MCKHINIYHLGHEKAYCKDCRTRITLEKGWHDKYKPTTKVDVYELKDKNS